MKKIQEQRTHVRFIFLEKRTHVRVCRSEKNTRSFLGLHEKTNACSHLFPFPEKSHQTIWNQRKYFTNVKNRIGNKKFW